MFKKKKNENVDFTPSDLSKLTKKVLEKPEKKVHMVSLDKQEMQRFWTKPEEEKDFCFG